MSSFNQIKYIVGIDLGATTSGVSIAHVDDPFNIITVSSWNNSKKRSQKFLSSILYPSDDNDTPICGIESLDVGPGGIYVENIGQYLVDFDASDKKLHQMMDSLTIKKIVTDYLRYFVKLAIERLQVHDKIVHNVYFQEFINENFINEHINSICYCLVCPTALQEFMKDCFIEAKIIKESETELRFSFITEAVATAYYQLSLDRKETGIQNDKDYLVCNLGDTSIGLAKIHAASTESLSTVTEISDDITQGSINLDIKLKDYLTENMVELNLNISLIDQFVEVFSQNIKYDFGMEYPEDPAMSQEDVDGNLIEFTYEDLKRIVFKPFIEDVINFISNAYESHGQCKLFLSGKYGHDYYFNKKLSARDKGHRIYHIVDESFNAISSGAVSSKMNTYKAQIPFIGAQQSDVMPILDEPVNKTSMKDYDFIVGIDFGTTFSGCSYVQLKDKHGNHMDKRTIKTIKESWPGGNVLTFGKTPTLLMYDHNMKPKYWGEEARLQAKRHKDLDLLGNFKLFLCPEHLEEFYGQNPDLVKIKEESGFGDDKTSNKKRKNDTFAVKVIADYLKFFKNHVVEYIVGKEMGENFSYLTKAKLLKKYKMRYVITVPAIWSSSARDTMVQAAIEASIIKTNQIDQLLIVSELEAVALFCENIITEDLLVSKHMADDKNFMVLDAGGGTVDLVNFNLQLNERKEPMFSQIGYSLGDTCGSTYLDVRFKNYLYEFYRTFGINIDIENIQLDEVVQEFTQNQKPDFMPNLQGDGFYDIHLPGKSVKNFTRDVGYIMTNESTTLRMRNKDLKNQVFDPIVHRIFALIDHQLMQAKKHNKEIDTILMVGGFSQSRYLQKCIEDQYKGVCNVIIPFEGPAGVSRGAVFYGLNPRMIISRASKQSFALEVQAPFVKNLTDTLQRIVKGPDGIENFEKERLEHFVAKDQYIESEKKPVHRKDVFVVYPNAAVIAIYSSDSEDFNNRYVTNSHTKIMEAKVIMPLVAGQDGRKIHFTVSLQVKHIGVSVTIECQDPVINAEVQRITNNQKSSLIFKPKYNLNVASFKQPLIMYSLAKTAIIFSIRA